MIASRLAESLAAIDRQIARIEQIARSEVAALQKRKAILTQVQAQITPELERAVTLLESIGILIQSKD